MRRHHIAATLAVMFLGCGSAEETTEGEASVASTTADPLRVGIRVRVAAVRSGAVARRDDTTGVVYAFHKATVNAETEGRVVERRIERGDAVQEAAVLFELDSSRPALELRRATATVRARETDLAHAKRELSRGQKLIAQNAISEQRRDDLLYGVEKAENELALARVTRDTARRILADATIRAPFGAVVEDTSVDVGDFVAPGAPVATLVELSRVRLRAGVTASETAGLEIGLTASARFAALGGNEVDAVLKSVGLVADPANGTYPVEFWIDNPAGRLREGMVGSITLPTTPRSGLQLRLPRAALVRHTDGLGVFLVEGEGDEAHAVARTIHVGQREGDWIEVVDGIEDGDWVVVDGQFALRDGAPVVAERIPELAASP